MDNAPAGVSPSDIKSRVEAMKARFVQRDMAHARIIAMREGEYEKVAPEIFADAGELSQPLVSNLIDIAARDIAEVMAPVPGLSCPPVSLDNGTDRKRQSKRAAIANSYVQGSHLQDQMFGGADRFNSFGYMAYIVRPEFAEQRPHIFVDDSPGYYTLDWHGRTVSYAKVWRCSKRDVVELYPHVRDEILGHCAGGAGEIIEIVEWYDREHTALVVPESGTVIAEHPNHTKGCPVHIVERPKLTRGAPRGSFDDVIWVQIARAAIANYKLEAVRRSATAPIVLPDDVDYVDMGPFSTLVTKNPAGAGVLPLNISPGLFPVGQDMEREQLVGSRYPEGRTGSFDASIITGQGVQALMGTFSTQVQTFQRLNATRLEDVIADCFYMDESLWGETKKSVRVLQHGAPQEIEYTPAKDIAGNHTVLVTYGATAGLDPNRALVLILQSMAGGLMSKGTGMRNMGAFLDLDVEGEERRLALEKMDDSLASALAMLPQTLPQMAATGSDPRELVLQIVQARNLLGQGKSVAEAIEQTFAPKLPPQEQTAPANPLAALAAAGIPGLAGPQSPASEMLMLLGGTSPSGAPQMGASVSRMLPI